ncbi:hypothetical protein BU25DRAFT_423864 [Macroventuria anomochaeta]|uniref:Uncharacterized protein n=1 Tax=Macroventuria anomochaeta TaxID=301207 RepID=A0ACB6RUJ9_9PLEO|nr:uncharacterized protein BU25DRAFT_423864 [Macroventuria anomochaeta]KAF2624758.1 hypothetical protein BU25DRAFT_423864 [Macroventuria anomochaeta]
MRRQLRRTDYTVGWVCALPVELAAARLMLDEKHEDLERDPGDNDENLYVLGSIEGHNVAIGCLPAGQTGNNSAAVVATQMLATFKKIRFGLMVGIGGGVPSAKADVRLGDVVVSQPDNTYGGVVQYDMGKTTRDGFVRKGSLDSPPQALLNALSRIQMNEWLVESGLSKHVLKLERSKFQRSRAGPDVLYDAAYDHENPSSQTCDMCSVDRIQARKPRNDEEEVVVHYGTIASGNQVIKNAAERDKASAQLGGVLCFEMEAAGLMNTFPCLVVRGISDYADSHKNDRWQAYAAGVAAAYAKEVLSVIKPTEVAGTRIADNDTGQSSDTPLLRTVQAPRPQRQDHDTRNSKDLSCADIVTVNHVAGPKIPRDPSQKAANEEIHQPSSPETRPEKHELSDEQRNAIKASLHFKQRDARLLTLKQAQAKTCRWLLKNPKYSDWMHVDKINEHRGFFWIKGKPGSGKSIMMKFLFSQAKKSMRGSLVLSFFFNARGEDLEKTTSGLYRALLLQLLEKAPKAWEIFEDDDLGTSTLDLIEESGWQDEVLRQLFVQSLQKLGDQRVVCFVDALDECPEDDIRDMVSFFEEIGEIESAAEFRVCFSSRHYPEISIRTGLQLVLEAEAEHTNDITVYIDANLKIKETAQFEDVRAEILRKASGIFLWVHLVIPMLNKEYDSGRIKALKKRLAQIPAGLHNLFADMLTRDRLRLEYLCVCVQVILHAARPLKPNEFRIAIETYCDEKYTVDQCCDPVLMSSENLRKFVLDASKGLAEITKSKEPTVQWIHESVRDFFIKEDGMIMLRSAEDTTHESGHSILVKICLRQLDFARSVFGHPSDVEFYSRFTKPESVHQQAPLVQYALDFMFYHANWVQKSSLDQTSFLEMFQHSYEQIWSLLCPATSRSIDRSTHILYLLSEYGADELIRVHPERDDHFYLKGGHFGLPLLAALYAGHNAAARALVGLPPAPEEENTIPGQSKPRRSFALKKENYRASRHALSYLCEYGDTELLEAALKSERFNVDYDVAHECYRNASSEAIVETLASFPATSTESLFRSAVDASALAPPNFNDDPLASINLPYLKLVLSKAPSAINQSHLWGGHTCLLAYAADRGFEKIMRLCIEATEVSNRQHAVLAAVCGRINQSGRTSILRQLFEVGLDSDYDNSGLERALFEIICQPHNEDVVSLVLARTKLNLETTKQNGMTPLLWALHQGRKAYVKMFLDAGSDPAARLHDDGTTALILAVKLGDLSSFRLILSKTNCEPNARDYYRRTALSWCAMVADDCAITMISDLLKRPDVQPNSKDKSGRTALMRGVDSGNLKVVEALLQDVRVDPDFGPCHRSTPLRLSLMRYVEEGTQAFFEMAKTLLQTCRADPHCARKRPTPAEIANDLEHDQQDEWTKLLQDTAPERERLNNNGLENAREQTMLQL